MIQSASLLTINNTPLSSDFLFEVLMTSLAAAAVAVLLSMALLSFDPMTDFTKTFTQRLRSSALAMPMMWALVGLAAGLNVFGTVFFGLIVTVTTGLGLGASMMIGFDIFAVLFAMLFGVTYKAVTAYQERHDINI